MTENRLITFRNGQTVCPLGQGTWKIGIAIPKAGSIAHVEENYRSFSIQLTKEGLRDLDMAFPAPTRKTALAGW